MKMKVALLGDSTLDNKYYTGRKPAVSEHLRQNIGPDCSVSLLAVDGHRIHNVYDQIKQLPADTTHILLSVGGNDALSHSYILEDDNGSYYSVLSELASIYSEFEVAYTSLVKKLKNYQLPLIISTIYKGHFDNNEVKIYG